MYLFITDFAKGGELAKQGDKYVIEKCGFDPLSDQKYYQDELAAIIKLIVNRKKRPIVDKQKETLISLFSFCLGLEDEDQKEIFETLARAIFNTDHNPLENKFSDDNYQSEGEDEEEDELKEQDF
jgi:hypothetical protein